MKNHDSIRSADIFAGLADNVVDEMIQHFHRKTVPARMMLMASEQAAASVLVLMTGTVKICVSHGERETILNIIGAGEIIGEMSVLDGLGHSADVITLEETTFLRIDSALFKHYLDTVPGFACNLARILSRRLRLSTSRIEALSTLDVPGRIAHQILAFGREYGHKQENGDVVIPLCLTQNDLAELVGATRTRVNQALGSFKNCNAISVTKNQHIIFHDTPALLKRCR